MTIYLAALLIGVVAGLRTMTAPAAVSWAASLGAIHLNGFPGCQVCALDPDRRSDR
jgi:uncharacterized membrane protein